MGRYEQGSSPRTRSNLRRTKNPVPELSPDKSCQKVTSVWQTIPELSPLITTSAFIRTYPRPGVLDIAILRRFSG
jgi:hypothetical protein